MAPPDAGVANRCPQLARRPPPDPAVVVAEELVRNAWPSVGWHGDSDSDSGHARFISDVRDLFTPEALAGAVAKIEADR